MQHIDPRQDIARMLPEDRTALYAVRMYPGRSSGLLRKLMWWSIAIVGLIGSLMWAELIYSLIVSKV